MKKRLKVKFKITTNGPNLNVFKSVLRPRIGVPQALITTTFINEFLHNTGISPFSIFDTISPGTPESSLKDWGLAEHTQIHKRDAVTEYGVHNISEDLPVISGKYLPTKPGYSVGESLLLMKDSLQGVPLNVAIVKINTLIEQGKQLSQSAYPAHNQMALKITDYVDNNLQFIKASTKYTSDVPKWRSCVVHQLLNIDKMATTKINTWYNQDNADEALRNTAIFVAPEQFAFAGLNREDMQRLGIYTLTPEALQEQRFAYNQKQYLETNLTLHLGSFMITHPQEAHQFLEKVETTILNSNLAPDSTAWYMNQFVTSIKTLDSQDEITNSQRLFKNLNGQVTTEDFVNFMSPVLATKASDEKSNAFLTCEKEVSAFFLKTLIPVTKELDHQTYFSAALTEAPVVEKSSWMDSLYYKIFSRPLPPATSADSFPVPSGFVPLPKTITDNIETFNKNNKEEKIMETLAQQDFGEFLKRPYKVTPTQGNLDHFADERLVTAFFPHANTEPTLSNEQAPNNSSDENIEPENNSNDENLNPENNSIFENIESENNSSDSEMDAPHDLRNNARVKPPKPTTTTASAENFAALLDDQEPASDTAAGSGTLGLAHKPVVEKTPIVGEQRQRQENTLNRPSIQNVSREPLPTPATTDLQQRKVDITTFKQYNKNIQQAYDITAPLRVVTVEVVPDGNVIDYEASDRHRETFYKLYPEMEPPGPKHLTALENSIVLLTNKKEDVETNQNFSLNRSLNELSKTITNLSTIAQTDANTRDTNRIPHEITTESQLLDYLEVTKVESVNPWTEFLETKVWTRHGLPTYTGSAKDLQITPAKELPSKELQITTVKDLPSKNLKPTTSNNSARDTLDNVIKDEQRKVHERETDTTTNDSYPYHTQQSNQDLANQQANLTAQILAISRLEKIATFLGIPAEFARKFITPVTLVVATATAGILLFSMYRIGFKTSATTIYEIIIKAKTQGMWAAVGLFAKEFFSKIKPTEDPVVEELVENTEKPKKIEKEKERKKETQQKPIISPTVKAVPVGTSDNQNKTTEITTPEPKVLSTITDFLMSPIEIKNFVSDYGLTTGMALGTAGIVAYKSKNAARFFNNPIGVHSMPHKGFKQRLGPKNFYGPSYK